MLPLLLASIVAFQDAPRLRIELPNRATVFVEKFDKATKCAIHLVASSRGVEETNSTHGWRHLMEHLMVKGQRGTLDRDLESQGLFLRAQTYRDYMVVSIEGPNNRLDRALDAIAEVLKPLQTTQDAIAKETKLISSELAIGSDLSKLGVAAWAQVYGERGLDPQGHIETMLKATPASILDLQKKHFAPRNVVLAVCGDFDLNLISAKAKKIVGVLAEQQAAAYQDRTAGELGRADADSGFGELRAIPVKGCLSRKTLATIVAGLAMSVDNRNVTMTYTFTNRNGLVSVGQSADNSGMGLAIDAMDASAKAGLFELGRAYAVNWIGGLLSNPSEHTRLRAILMATGSFALPDEMLDYLRSMPMNDFLEAFDQFTTGKCTVVAGGAR